jgi:hypothetical protein
MVLATNLRISDKVRVVATAIEKLFRLTVLDHLFILLVAVHLPASSMHVLRSAVNFRLVIS